jgi:hypothetical protein
MVGRGRKGNAMELLLSLYLPLLFVFVMDVVVMNVVFRATTKKA